MSDRAYAKAQAQQKTLTGPSSKGSLLQRTRAYDEGEKKSSFIQKQSREPEADTETALPTVPPIVHAVLGSSDQRDEEAA